jgi:hypothetical protein
MTVFEAYGLGGQFIERKKTDLPLLEPVHHSHLRSLRRLSLLSFQSHLRHFLSQNKLSLFEPLDRLCWRHAQRLLLPREA